ncbi:unnamed protein product [Lupinus luteus]|uniref:Uncharacterized protein n=1 Tax=Lupinus luteus TaxID=3873 RepID=A0AAV1XJF4_LUPLU
MMKKKKNDMMMEENKNTPRVSRTKDGPATAIVSAATSTERSNKKSRFATTAVDDGGGIDCSGKYFKSCMGGLIADCVALCCCPCAVLHCFALAFVKAPWVVGRRQMNLRVDTNVNVVGEMDNVTVNAAFEAEKVWLELYQIGHLDFGRVSFSHD